MSYVINQSTKSIISKYSVTNPGFLHVKDILKNFVDGYEQKIEFFLLFRKWKLLFSDTIINVKTDRLYNIHRAWNLRRILLSKIEYFESYGYKFSHISEMNIVFITDLRNMTYEYYFK